MRTIYIYIIEYMIYTNIITKMMPNDELNLNTSEWMLIDKRGVKSDVVPY